MRLSAAREFSAPAEHSNYRHLIGDIAWFGVALAATSRFLSVFAIRIGATPLDLGLISSLPPLVLLFSSLLGSWWLRRYTDNIARSLLWPGIGMRLPFLLPAFAPLLPIQWQPLWLIVAVTIPAIPQGISGVIFNVLVRQGITDRNMTPMLSVRSVAMNETIAAGAVAFGIWLESAPFPLNYQVMFVVAFLFSLASAWHCQQLRPLTKEPPPLPATSSQTLPVVGGGPWRSPRFLIVALLIMLSYISFTSITSIIPLRLVGDLGANEGFMALSALSELAAGACIALFATRLVTAFGNRGIIGLAMVFTAASALVLAFAQSLPLTLIGTALSGGAWTAATIGVYGFFIENMPYDEVTSYSTAFQQTAGLALFIGPMIGSGLVQAGMPVVQVLLIGAALRFLAGILTQNSITIHKGRLTRRAERASTALTTPK